MKEDADMKNNVVYQKGIGAKHYKDYAPLYNFGRRVIIGRYGSMAMEYMKKTAPLAYKEYCGYSEFKYILAGINDMAAKRMTEVKRELKKKHPSPKTDDFFELAEHNAIIVAMAEEIVINEVVCQPHITDDEVIRAHKAKHTTH